MAKGNVHVIIDPVIHEAALAAKAVTGITLTDVVESAFADFALETTVGADILLRASKLPGSTEANPEDEGTRTDLWYKCACPSCGENRIARLVLQDYNDYKEDVVRCPRCSVVYAPLTKA